MFAIILTLIISPFVLFNLYYFYLHFTRKANEPPLITGWLPYLGVAIQFGKDSGVFLRQCQAKHGDVFTLYIAGQRMTFVLDPRNFNIVLRQSTSLQFKPIADDISIKAFDTSRKNTYRQDLDDDVHRLYLKHLQGSALQPLTMKFQDKLLTYVQKRFLGDQPMTSVTHTSIIESRDHNTHHQQQQQHHWQESKLWRFVNECVFYAGGETMFGDGFVREEILNDFLKFDNKFPLLVAGVPADALGVKQVRTKLAELFVGESWAKQVNKSDLIAGRDETFARYELSPRDIGHFQNAMLWASQANTIPAAFWSLAYLVAHPQVQQKVYEEIKQVLASSQQQQSSSANTSNDDNNNSNSESKQHSLFTTDVLNRLVYTEATINEAFRLASLSMMIRIAVDNTVLNLNEYKDNTTNKVEYMIRKGDRVCMFPQLLHMDPAVYENPEKYHPERYLDENGAKRTKFTKDHKELSHYLLPFGGGVSMCPGRFFAMNEIRLFVAVLVYHLELRLATPTSSSSASTSAPTVNNLPPIDQTRAGLGMMPPVREVPFEFRIRQH